MYIAQGNNKGKKQEIKSELPTDYNLIPWTFEVYYDKLKGNKQQVYNTVAEKLIILEEQDITQHMEHIEETQLALNLQYQQSIYKMVPFSTLADENWCLRLDQES